MRLSSWKMLLKEQSHEMIIMSPWKMLFKEKSH
jgi:hypothetical protein